MNLPVHKPVSLLPFDTLLSLGLVGKVELFHEGTRDNPKINVYRDAVSGVIFHENPLPHDHYQTTPEHFSNSAYEAQRRYTQFGSLIVNKSVLEIGSGEGEFIKVSGCDAIDPQFSRWRQWDSMFHDIKNVPSNVYDSIFMFHVFEHLLDPMGMLEQIKRVARPKAKLVIETPNADDALLQLESFRKFTLWGEHIFLHTKRSITRLLDIAGCKGIKVEGYQRYDLGNHINWFVNGTPDGPAFGSIDDRERYLDMLIQTGQTDTLIITADL